MPRRIPIRLKLAAALAVPICALLVVAVLEVVQTADHDREIRRQTELATASAGPSGIIVALQNERNFASVYLLGFADVVQLPVATYEESVEATDAAIETFRDDIAAAGSEVEATFGPAIDEVIPQLEPLRTTVTGFDGELSLENQPVVDPLFNDYTAQVDRLFEASGQVPLAIDDPTLRRGVELGDIATRHIESAARLSRVFLLAGVSDGLNDSGEIAEAAGHLGQIEEAVAQVGELGTGPFADSAEAYLADMEASGYIDLGHSFLDSGRVQIDTWMPTLSRGEDEGAAGFRTRAYGLVDERADELTAESSARMVRYGALAGAAVLLAAMATWLVSRSITRPLRNLTRQAKEMADRRLPEAVTDILETPLGEDVTVPQVPPVRVNTRDEVADVAAALNTVQDSALDLAVEQAVLRRNIADSFVNLGRRNQNLLGRQLDFITELESRETEPDSLANLFRLDHLATRMRRNAESLLVLAGIEPPRQWAAPVRLTDVIRAALGEVEDYQRVTVRGVEPATIVGSAAADLAHLLAELIENALVFSPPDQTVDIRGRNRPEGYTLAIIDSGLGMPAGDIAAANRRLAGAESFTIAPSKYLGHYVAGNLAARHDIHVHLDNSPGNGVTATVDLPPMLLTADAPVSAPLTPPHGQRAVGGPAPGLGFAPDTAGALPAGPAGPAPAPAAGLPPAFGRPERPAAFGQPPAQPPAPPADAPWDSPEAVPPAPPIGPGAFPGGPRPTVPPQPAVASRTASGLVKRNRRPGDQAPVSAVPDADLLASLSNVTDNLGTRSPHVPPPAAPRPGGPTPARSWPAPPGAMPPGNGGRPALPSRQAGAPAPGGPAPRPAETRGATASGLARRVRGAQLPNTQPLSLRRNQEPPSAASGGYRLGDHDDADGRMLGNGNTNGRGNGHPPATPPSPGAGSRAEGDPASSAAQNVYGFLTSFTQGVQRGLEEARRDPTTPKENP